MKKPLVIAGWIVVFVGFWGGVGTSVSWALDGDWAQAGAVFLVAAVAFVLGSQLMKYGFTR